jgi:hypothetical protein
MKSSQLVLALAALCVSTSAFASILQLEDSADRVSGVLISKGGKMSIPGQDALAMSTVAAGTRTKLGFMTIYVGELLVSDKSKYACREEKSLDSLNDLAGVAVKLNIQYGITEAQLEEAFTSGFEANKVKVTPEIQKFVDSIRNGGPIPSGSKVVVAGQKLANGTEVVTYENASGKAFTTPGPAGLVRSILSLWVGKTTDGGLKDVRNNFVNCKIK